MKVLYLTYDGLLDPLGASQILPYIKNIALIQDKVTVLSFEKIDKYIKGADKKKAELISANIKWFPLSFTSKYGLFGKLWDLIKMYLFGLYLALKYKVDIVHARSHGAAQVGLLIKRLYGIKLIFDFRGLWADERVDKGGWDLSKTIDRFQYTYYKRVEKKLLSKADQIIVLTEAVVTEINKIRGSLVENITVIPCCADFNHFHLVTFNDRVQARDKVHIPQNSCVLGYLGSVGSMYLVEKFFRLFQLASEIRDDIFAVVITQDIKTFKNLKDKYLPKALDSRMVVRYAQREEVPLLLSTIDILVNFVKPSYARLSMSPTKMIESFAAGIPVISNEGIGDVSKQISLLNGGVILSEITDAELNDVIGRFHVIQSMGGEVLRMKAMEILSLEYANKQYEKVYSQLFAC